MTKTETDMRNDALAQKTVCQELDELRGKSWFDVEEERRKLTGRMSLTRVLFSALIEKNSLDGISQEKNFNSVSEKLKKAIKGCFKSEVTSEDNLAGGIILLSESKESVLPAAALGFIETMTPSDAYDILRKINASGQLQSIRILLASDDCPCHDFGVFDFYHTNPPPEDEVDIEAEGATRVFAGIMTNLCEETLMFPSTSRKGVGITKTLIGPQRKAVPSTKRVIACAKCNLYPTLEEFLEIFESPIYFEF